jgi:hypothetical protein
LSGPNTTSAANNSSSFSRSTSFDLHAMAIQLDKGRLSERKKGSLIFARQPAVQGISS